MRIKTINPFDDVIKIAHLSNVLSSRYWFKTPTSLIKSTSKQTSLISRKRKELVNLNPMPLT